MKLVFFLAIFLALSLDTSAQKKRLALDINYGFNGNFFVRSYDEQGGPNNKTYLYKKDFLGTIGGVELKYKLKKGALTFGYSRSTNKGKKNYAGTINGVDIIISDFKIRHNNDFFQFAYENRFKKTKPNFKYQIGLVYVTMQQQEIAIENFANFVNIKERNTRNSKLEEAGVFFGVEYRKMIDTKLELGIRLRGYYLISVSSLEAITFSPTLTYHF